MKTCEHTRSDQLFLKMNSVSIEVYGRRKKKNWLKIGEDTDEKCFDNRFNFNLIQEHTGVAQIKITLEINKCVEL